MKIEDALALLQQEQPHLIEAMRAILAAPDPTTLRQRVGDLMVHTATLNGQLHDKRAMAESLLLLRGGLATDANGDNARYELRHIPDVMIRTLCRIAEVKHLSSASQAWLDRMEARHLRVRQESPLERDNAPEHT